MSHDSAVEAVADRSSDASTEQRLRFNGDTQFLRVLRGRVDDYFRDSGRRPRDNLRMYVKTAAILLGFVASYVLLVFFAATWWQGVLLAVALGLAMTQIGFNIQHDAGHQAYSDKPWVNALFATTLDVIGGSSYLWRWKHAVYHHSYVNIHGHDADIDLGVLARLAPSQKRRSLHGWQHYYLWLLYGVTAMRWHFYGDFRDVITGRIGDRPFPRMRGWDMVVFVVGKLVFFTLAFGVPLMLHSFAVVAGFYLLVATITGILLALVFQLAHAVEEADFPEPDAESGRMHTAWAIHQLQTTVDFARDNRVLAGLIGDLNYQIEHHLFSRICHVHYPAISKVVADTCHEYGVRYSAHRGFWSGIASHYRWLRRMGLSQASAGAA